MKDIGGRAAFSTKEENRRGRLRQERGSGLKKKGGREPRVLSGFAAKTEGGEEKRRQRKIVRRKTALRGGGE